MTPCGSSIRKWTLRSQQPAHDDPSVGDALVRRHIGRRGEAIVRKAGRDRRAAALSALCGSLACADMMLVLARMQSDGWPTVLNLIRWSGAVGLVQVDQLGGLTSGQNAVLFSPRSCFPTEGFTWLAVPFTAC
jgi:hypothetical protein